MFWERPQVCKWGAESPRAQMKKMSLGMVGVNALGLPCKSPRCWPVNEVTACVVT